VKTIPEKNFGIQLPVSAAFLGTVNSMMLGIAVFQLRSSVNSKPEPTIVSLRIFYRLPKLYGMELRDDMLGELRMQIRIRPFNARVDVAFD
jgi:hypothetical protein